MPAEDVHRLVSVVRIDSLSWCLKSEHSKTLQHRMQFSSSSFFGSAATTTTFAALCLIGYGDTKFPLSKNVGCHHGLAINSQIVVLFELGILDFVVCPRFFIV